MSRHSSFPHLLVIPFLPLFATTTLLRESSLLEPSLDWPYKKDPAKLQSHHSFISSVQFPVFTCVYFFFCNLCLNPKPTKMNMVNFLNCVLAFSPTSTNSRIYSSSLSNHQFFFSFINSLLPSHFCFLLSLMDRSMNQWPHTPMDTKLVMVKAFLTFFLELFNFNNWVFNYRHGPYRIW